MTRCMWKSQWLAGGLITALAMNIAFGARPTDHMADIAQLSESACELGRAYARQDLAKLDELSATDYVQTDTRGGVLKRTECLEFVRDRKSKLSIECDNIEVRLYGEAAVVIGGWIYTKQRPRGRPSYAHAVNLRLDKGRGNLETACVSKHVRESGGGPLCVGFCSGDIGGQLQIGSQV